MRKFILASCVFSFLFLSCANASQKIEQFQDALNDISNLSKELTKDVPEVKGITKRINFFVAKINKSLNKKPQACESTIKSFLKKINTAIEQLRQKDCALPASEKEDLIVVSCAMDERFSGLLPLIEESYLVASSNFVLDDNLNNIPDVCETGRGSTCTNPCGPTLCCKENQKCKIGDPCMGDPTCTSVPSFECMPPLTGNILVPVRKK